MIEERRPRLEADRHRGAIHFHEDVIRQIRDLVREAHALERIRKRTLNGRILQQSAGLIASRHYARGRVPVRNERPIQFRRVASRENSSGCW